MQQTFFGRDSAPDPAGRLIAGTISPTPSLFVDQRPST